jgi:hypothetical protein
MSPVEQRVNGFQLTHGRLHSSKRQSNRPALLFAPDPASIGTTVTIPYWKPLGVFWCTTDIGWIAGHSYITHGPLTLGGTRVVFEGMPTYPNADRFCDTLRQA